MPKFPEPPSPLAVAAETRPVPAGSRLWRVYFAGGRYPTTWNAFRFFGPTQARFDHHDEPARPQRRGILYAAADATTCLAEAFQAGRVINRRRGSPWLVGLELTAELILLDLTGSWPTRAGASMAINTGPRPRARRWSQAIYATYSALEGLHYPSSMHANQPSLALYERAQHAMPATPVFSRALADAALLPRLAAAARRLGYKLV